MGNMMKKKLGKSVLLASMLVVALLVTSVSAFAYGITEPEGGFVVELSANSTDIKTLDVPVTGASTNQITVVVRKDGNAWLTDPNANVLYIDQVTGEGGASTTLTMSFDPVKWTTTKGTYKIFVGGSGQSVETATLTVGTPTHILKPKAPTGVTAGAKYGAEVTLALAEAAPAGFTDAIYYKLGSGSDTMLSGNTLGGGSDGSYTVWTLRTSDEDSGVTSKSDTITFSVDAASVTTLANTMNSITAASAAADIAKIKGTGAGAIPTLYTALSADQKAVLETTLGTTYALKLDTLKGYRNDNFDAALQAGTPSIVTDATAILALTDETEIETAWNAVKGKITTLANTYTGDTSANGDITDRLFALVPGLSDKVGSDITPKDPVVTAVPGTTNSTVSFTLSSGSYDTSNITIGSVQAWYSTERGVFVATIPNADISSGTFALVASAGTTPTFTYGDVNLSTESDDSDLLNMKEFLKSEGTGPIGCVYAGDLNGSGEFDDGDLLIYKEYLKAGGVDGDYVFPVLRPQ